MTLNPKQAVKEWLSEQWEKRVKEPIGRKTEEMEGEVSRKWNEYSGKAKETAWKPVDYYRKQDAFYRGIVLNLCRFVDFALDCEWELVG